MITKDHVTRAQVIFERLSNLYFESKNPDQDPTANPQKNELTGILLDVQDLNAILMKIWRDVR